ncbi:MAG: ATP-binding protein, partial [Verrucomicrobiota bacterium]
VKGGDSSEENIEIGPLLSSTLKISTVGKPVKLDVCIDDIPLITRGDCVQIQQVFQNIVVNGCQAMPGGGSMFVSAKAEFMALGNHHGIPEGDYVCIRIKDRGCGMEKKTLDRIFDPYFSTKSDGNGIGLASCKAIVRAHRGHILAESTLNVGTEFYIYLPREMDETGDIIEDDVALVSEELSDSIPMEESDESLPEANPRPHEVPVVGAGNLLVVDDDKRIREMAIRLLTHIGYEPIPAGTGEEAIEIFKDHQAAGDDITVMLIDLNLAGGLSGQDVMREIKKIDRHVRMVATSGAICENNRQSYVESGWDAALPKPYSLQELSECIAEAIAHKKVAYN